MQVGWVSTKRISKEILQAMQVGDRLHKENFEKKFYRQCKLGCGDNTEADESQLTHVQVGDRSNKEKLDSQFLQTMQVGEAPTQKL